MTLVDRTNSSVTALRGIEQEFYWLWILATTTYGVGDVVTTIALLKYSPVVQEKNLLLSALVRRFGDLGLISLKLAVFGGCLALSLYALVVWEDRWAYLTPPLLLTLVGAAVTANNIMLLAG